MMDANRTVTDLETAHLLPTYGSRPLSVRRGRGCYIEDDDGKLYLDFITGIGVNALGYGHPAILAAIQAQVVDCIHASNLHRHPYQGELAARLASWSGLDRVFLSSSGTEAMEAALKAARARANARGRTRHRIIALDNGFHGRTAGSLAITGQPKYREPFLPLSPDVVFVPANDTDALTAADHPDTIAIVAETIQGEGGIHPLTGGFLSELRSLAARRDALWIADETQCGLGRTGQRFAYMHHSAGLPDIVVTAKPLGGGLPLGATMFSESAGKALTEGLHGTTFGGGPLACRAALAFLNEVDLLLPSIRRHGAYLHHELHRRLSGSPLVREIRGTGLMAGIDLKTGGQSFVAKALAEGLVINCTHGNVLRLLPPYVVNEEMIDSACAILERVLTVT